MFRVCWARACGMKLAAPREATKLQTHRRRNHAETAEVTMQREFVLSPRAVNLAQLRACAARGVRGLRWSPLSGFCVLATNQPQFTGISACRNLSTGCSALGVASSTLGTRCY